MPCLRDLPQVCLSFPMRRGLYAAKMLELAEANTLSPEDMRTEQSAASNSPTFLTDCRASFCQIDSEGEAASRKATLSPLFSSSLAPANNAATNRSQLGEDLRLCTMLSSRQGLQRGAGLRFRKTFTSSMQIHALKFAAT